MQDQIVSFETARLAKEKGFDWATHHWHNEESELKYGFYRWSLYTDEYEFNADPTNYNYSETSTFDSDDDLPFGTAKVETNICSAPTQSLLQKWLRDRGIDIDVKAASGFGAKVYKASVLIAQPTVFKMLQDDIVGITYEQTLETALFEALKELR